MSCKEKPISKNKHYSLLERKLFLQILEKYKNVIEIKKSDSTTLKDKDVAWSEVCIEYNQSALISQERTVQQLKKLWANLKQSQRDALTKEKQSRLATGGGPEETEANVDPDVLNIAPHLMENAPVLFTSNMTDIEIENKREYTFDIISTNENLDLLDPTNNNEDLISDESDKKSIDSQDKRRKIEFNTSTNDIITISDTKNKDYFKNNETEQKIFDTHIVKKYNKQSIHSSTTDTQKKKRKCISQDLSETEEILRMQRIKQIMDQDQQLTFVKLRHEENIAKMKENHLQQLNEIEIQQKNVINNLEIEINKAKLKILENQYSNKENINFKL